MLRILSLGILVLFMSLATAKAQSIDHGATGTLNLDYFNPTNDAHMRWLINDIETHHLKPAISSFASGDLQKARVDIDYLLVRLVNHPRGLAFAGVLANAMKNSAWAISHYERAVRLYPQYALTHAQYGKYLADNDQLQAGLKRLKKAIEMDASLVAAHVWIAAAYAKSGNAELAREAADRARSLGYKGDLAQFGLKQ